MSETANYILNLFTTLLQDVRFQVVFGFLVLAQWTWRLPRPRKGAGKKSVFITGCDSGMGHRMARRFDEMGMHVFAGCLQPEGSGALKLKESCSNRLHIVPIDISKDEQVREAVDYVKANLPAEDKGLYCLINNAGIFSLTNFDMMTLETCENIIAVNLMGTIRVTKHFMPLISQTPGRIVTITSIAARLVHSRIAVYAATKFALNGFFSSLRHEVSKKGIHIATIEPGDFSGCTDIMQLTKANLDEAWNNLSPEEKESKSELYEKTQRKLAKSKIAETEQEKMFKILLGNVEDAMLAEEPHWRYISAPFTARMCYWILRNLPERVAYKYMWLISG